MKKNFLPEEKLLRLIRGDGKQAPLRFSGPSAKLKPALSVKNLLILLVFLASLYLLASFLYPFLTPKKLNLALFSEKSVDFELGKNTQPVNPEISSQIAPKRDVFKPLSGGGAEDAPVVVAAAEEILRNFALMGIIFGDNPQAIIEDKKNQSTYYLAKGQFIGQYKVSDIQQGKVTLELNNKKYELHI